jgi:hypothetical protein
MNRQPEPLDQEPDSLDRLLAEAQWAEPTPEAVGRLREQWQSLMDNPQPIGALARRRRIMRRIVVFAAAAAVLAAVFLGISSLTSIPDANVAFAEVRKEIKKQVEVAKTITWKTVYYTKVSNKEGTRSWITTDTALEAYKAPGLYRDVRPGPCIGDMECVEIEDRVHGRKLQLYPKEKKALLFVLGKPTKEAIQAENGDPFRHLINMIPADAASLGKMNIGGREADGFRVVETGAVRQESRDYWVDSGTRRLVMIRAPGLDQYDPDKDPTRFNPPELSCSREEIRGCVLQDFAYDLDLDNSLFGLNPPKGYTVKAYHRAEVTEKDMIDWLGVLAEFYGQRFPDDVSAYLPSAEEQRRICHKPKKDRTPAEMKIAARAQANPDVVYHYPIHRFIEHTAGTTWHYLGKGVKLGDKDRIVCCYKLKGAKNPNTYRVVYGDLSVKDVAAEALPLPVGP